MSKYKVVKVVYVSQSDCNLGDYETMTDDMALDYFNNRFKDNYIDKFTKEYEYNEATEGNAMHKCLAKYKDFTLMKLYVDQHKEDEYWLYAIEKEISKYEHFEDIITLGLHSKRFMAAGPLSEYLFEPLGYSN